MATLTWDSNSMNWKKIGEAAAPAAPAKKEWRNRRGYRITRPQATHSFEWGQVVMEAKRSWVRFDQKPCEEVRRMLVEELGAVWSGTEHAWMIDDRLPAVEIDLAVSGVAIPMEEAETKARKSRRQMALPL